MQPGCRRAVAGPGFDDHAELAAIGSTAAARWLYSVSGDWRAFPAGGQDPGRPELRASHEDRDRVVELLRVAAGDGRLTADELDERLEAALTARTQRELVVLTADLPAAPGVAASRGAQP